MAHLYTFSRPLTFAEFHEPVQNCRNVERARFTLLDFGERDKTPDDFAAAMRLKGNLPQARLGDARRPCGNQFVCQGVDRVQWTAKLVRDTSDQLTCSGHLLASQELIAHGSLLLQLQ